MSRWIKGLNEEYVKRDLVLGFRRLRFSSSIENAYKQYFYQWLTERTRPICWISLAIFLVYSILDYQLFPDFVAQWTISIRLFFIYPIIIFLMWLSYQTVKPELFFKIYSLSYFLAGLAIVAIILSARLQQVYMPYDGLLLLMMFGYFVMKVPFFFAIAASSMIFLLYLVAGAVADIPQQEMVYDTFFLATATIIGGVGSYLQEHSQRTHFLGQLLLEFAQEKAEKQSEQKSKLVATASHELRQPLHAMNLLAENLSGELSNSQQQATMSRLQLSIVQLQELLASLFDISRLTVGVIKPHKKEVSCTQLINTLVFEYQPRCEAMGIQLSFTGEQNLNVYTDPLLLTRILRNLLENALKHSRASVITLSLVAYEQSEHQRIIEISVLDNGVGIAEEDQPKAFKEFNSLARYGGGLGVGLAVVKQLTEMLGISLNLISSKNKGCQFKLRLLRDILPIDEVDKTKPDSELLFSGSNNETQDVKKLLIVDDDREILASMKSVIMNWHYSVEAVDCPELALQISPVNIPDAMIIDYQYLNSPDTTGIELIQRLRQHFGTEVPALLLSAHTEIDLDSEVSGETVVAYKPLKPAKLKLMLNYLMTRK